MSTIEEIKEQHRREYELMRFRPIGIIYPIILHGGDAVKCLAYEVYEADGSLKGISYISFSKEWIKPSGIDYGDKWYRIVESEDGYDMHDTTGMYRTGIISKVMSLIDSVVVETEILGCDLKLD